MPLGTITKYNDDRGYGFIKPVDGSKSVFFHITHMEGDAPAIEGERVGYDLTKNTGKNAKDEMMATNIRYV